MSITLLPLNACLYAELFGNCKQKIGHVRADHDGRRWWTTWWSANEELKTPARKAEIDRVCGHVLDVLLKNGLPDIQALCAEYPQTMVGNPCEAKTIFLWTASNAAIGYGSLTAHTTTTSICIALSNQLKLEVIGNEQ